MAWTPVLFPPLSGFLLEDQGATVDVPSVSVSTTLHQPTTTATVSLGVPWIAPTAPFYQPTLNTTANIQSPTLSNISSTQQPALTVGPVTTAPATLNVAFNLFSPTIQQGDFVLTVPMLDVEISPSQPIAVASNNIETPIFSPSTSTHEPTAEQFNKISSPLLPTGIAYYQPSLTTGSVQIAAEALDSTPNTYAPAVNHALPLNVIPAFPTAHPPTFLTSAEVSVPSLGTGTVIYTPTGISAGTQGWYLGFIPLTGEYEDLPFGTLVPSRIDPITQVHEPTTYLVKQTVDLVHLSTIGNVHEPIVGESLSLFVPTIGAAPLVHTPTSSSDNPPTPPPVGDYAHTVYVTQGTVTVNIQADTAYLPEPGWDGTMNGGGANAAFIGTANHTLIKGFTTTGYSPPANNGVIHITAGNDIAIEDVEIRHNDEVGVWSRAEQTTIRDCYIHHQDRLGLSVGNYGSSNPNGHLVENTEIAYCNWLGNNSWNNDAGGAKFWETTNLTVRNVHSHHHRGPGLWAEKDNTGWTVEDCTVEYCQDAPGIFQETGYTHIIRRNTIRNCGSATPSWLWDAGIQIATSRNGQIHNNLIENCGNGISLSQQNRGTGLFGEWRLRNIDVYDNTVNNSNNTGAVQNDGDNSVFNASELDFWDNTYDSSHRFAWNNGWMDANDWRTYHPNDAIGGGISGGGQPGWPDAFMSYQRQTTPIVLNGESNVTIEYLSFENFYRSTGRPITLYNCDNITIRRIDTRGCTMGLVYAVNCTNLTIEYCRVENVAKEFIGQTLDWASADAQIPGFFKNENDCNVYQLNGCNGFTIRHIKGRYGNVEDAYSHFASSNGTVEYLEWEGAISTNQPTSDGSSSTPWTSDSGTGAILGDGNGDNVSVSNSSFINCGQVGIAIAAGAFNNFNNCVVYHQNTSQPINTAAYIWNQYSYCNDNSMTNCDGHFEGHGGFWNGGNCGYIDLSGSNFSNSNLNIEDYRVTL